MHIIRDSDLDAFPMRKAVEAIACFFQAAKNGKVVTPPRHTVVAGNGALTFTIGAELESTKTTGFRVYDTYPGRAGTDSEQIVAVYATEKSQLKGLVIGSKLGAIRTAAINAYAIKIMAKENIDQVCLIGAGHQAYFQLQALLTVRSPRKVVICNRTASKAKALLKQFAALDTIEITYAEDIQGTVRNSDLILCATSASQPVVKSSWIKDGALICSIGPKFDSQHELPTDIQQRAYAVVSDAPGQLTAYADSYFLSDINGIQALENFHLKHEIKEGYGVFLSTGRSGTEVVVADYALEYLFNKALLTP